MSPLTILGLVIGAICVGFGLYYLLKGWAINKEQDLPPDDWPPTGMSAA